MLLSMSATGVGGNPVARQRARSGKALKVLLTGGGTGGHVYPSLALLQILRQELDLDTPVYVGSRGRAEEKIVPRAGLPILYIRCAPWSGLNPLAMGGSLLKTLAGAAQSVRILLRERPDLILAAGGYVSAPVTLAAFLLRPFLRPALILQEQNVVPGLMNKIASLFADAVMVSFPETPYYLWNQRCVYTGYPVRDEFVAPPDPAAQRRSLDIPDDAFLVLVYGGSMGSRSMNRLTTSILAKMPRAERPLAILHASGLSRGDYDAWGDTVRCLRQDHPDIRVEEGEAPAATLALAGGLTYRLVPYLHQIAGCLAAADLVVCRGGAGTLAEVTALGKPAIVIPKRGLPGDHQELNAISLAERGGCEIVFERRDANGVDYVISEEFLSIFRNMLDNPERLNRIGEAARAQFQPRFKERIVTTVRHILAGEEADYVLEIEEPRSLHIRKQVDSLVDFLLKEPPDSFYRRFYGIRMEEDLRSPNWEEVNQGIKLCGALQRRDRIPDLLAAYNGGNGFMRRNILQALLNMDVWDAGIPDLVKRGLSDGYFEVRSTAVRVAGRHPRNLMDDMEIVSKMRGLVSKRFETFEVRAAALRNLPLFLPLDEYLELADNFRFARNVRLREGVLEGIRRALETGRIPPERLEQVREFVRAILITTSGFKPEFSIRGTYVDLFRRLSANGHSKIQGDSAS
jgi:UDP-N-acetylglucosamine--N-acetylmuramyl-(pentapeptide) pyrophosphoryl-undecaprenol N-acetylglucosamine transferase